MNFANVIPVNPDSVGTVLSKVKQYYKLKDLPKIVDYSKTEDNISQELKGRSIRIKNDFSTSIGYGGFFDTDTSGSQEIYMLEFMKRCTKEQADEHILSTTFGAGFRVVFKVSEFKNKMNFDIAGFAAKAQLGLAKVQVLFEVFGVGEEGIKDPDTDEHISLADFISFSSFNVEKYKEVVELEKKLIKYFERVTKDKLDPTIISIEIAPEVTEGVSLLHSAHSVNFALNRIKKKQSIKDTEKFIKDKNIKKIDISIVRAIYSSISEYDKEYIPNSKITSKDVDKATKLLDSDNITEDNVMPDVEA